MVSSIVSSAVSPAPRGSSRRDAVRTAATTARHPRKTSPRFDPRPRNTSPDPRNSPRSPRSPRRSSSLARRRLGRKCTSRTRPRNCTRCPPRRTKKGTTGISKIAGTAGIAGIPGTAGIAGIPGIPGRGRSTAAGNPRIRFRTPAGRRRDRRRPGPRQWSHTVRVHVPRERVTRRDDDEDAVDDGPEDGVEQRDARGDDQETPDEG